MDDISAQSTNDAAVEVTGAVSGRFEVLEVHEDGTVLLGPDTSARAIRRRLNSTPASADEFDAAFGDLPTGTN